jgi:hypothetical protein
MFANSGVRVFVSEPLMIAAFQTASRRIFLSLHPRRPRTVIRHSSVTGTATRPDPEATRLNPGAVIFYCAFGPVKNKPLVVSELK